MTSSQVSKKLDQKQPPSPGEPPPPPPVPPPQNTWKCAKCSTQETPVKRSGPQGPGTLCNACGLRIRKQNKAIADAGAAAAAAAGIPSNNRTRHKKIPPPKRLSHKRKLKQHPASPAIKRTERQLVDNNHPKSIPLPSASLHLPNVVAIPNHPPRPANQISAPLAPRIIVSPTPLPPSSNTPHLPDPVTAAPTPPICVPPPTSQTSPTPPSHTSPQPSIPSASVKPFASSGSASPPLPPQPPTTPEGVNLLPLHVPANAMVTQFPQCRQPQQNTPGEDIIAALHMPPVTVDVGSADSTNEAQHDDFPGSVFARSDSNATASTQVDMLGFFAASDKEESLAVLLGTAPNRLPDAHAGIDSVITQVTGCVPGTVVDPQNGLAGRCVDTLTMLEHMSAQLRENEGTIDSRIAFFAKRRDELTVMRNKISASITHLMSAKDKARKRQREVSESIARTTCLLNVLRKQMEFAAS